MSLLDRAESYDDVIVYPEIVETDMDGNIRTRASATGFPAKARFQVQNQSGTSSRRKEQSSEGYSTEQIYLMRFPRKFNVEHGILGAQSKVEWRGEMWSLDGDVVVYKGSRATSHTEYTVKRT